MCRLVWNLVVGGILVCEVSGPSGSGIGKVWFGVRSVLLVKGRCEVELTTVRDGSLGLLGVGHGLVVSLKGRPV